MLRIAFFPQFSGRFPTSSAWIRGYLPLAANGFAEIITCEGSDLEAGNVPDADVALVQRLALSNYNQVKLLAKRFQGRVFLDLDDDFLGFDNRHPEWAQYKDRLDAHEAIANFARQVTVSTDELGKRYATISAKTQTIPNGIHIPLFEPLRSMSVMRTFPTRILYFGTKTHQEDLARIIPLFDQTYEHRQDFQLEILGVTNEKVVRDYLKRVKQPAVPYPRFIRALKSREPYHVGVAPLERNVFNRHKSDLKPFEYAALGILPLVTDYGPYRSIAAHFPSLAALDDLTGFQYLVDGLSDFDPHQVLSWFHQQIYSGRNSRKAGQELMEVLAS